MTKKRNITIIGGGLAGLSLGIALRNHGVSTKVIEAGQYPRHKVCGEFISGVSEESLEDLGIEKLFKDAIRHRDVQWRLGEKIFRRDSLPRDALGISRYALDERLAGEFESIGGELVTNRRIAKLDQEEGVVWSAGRQAEPSKWIGLKAHFDDLELECDLELRLGRGAYVGASRIENGKVNVCGLFQRRKSIQASRTTALVSYVRANGLDAFADRLESSRMDPQSASGVSALAFAKTDKDSDRIQIGDAFAVMPPFTGNGMSLAFESALVAVPFLKQYGEASMNWQVTVRKTRKALKEAFGFRLHVSRYLHPWIHSRFGQNAFFTLSKARLVPFQTLLRQVR